MQSFKRYAEVYDLFNKDKPYKKEIEFIYNWAKKPRRILDIGCGTASYWKYFPYQPLGIEPSYDMIEKSRYSPFIYHGFPEMCYQLNNTFDCVTALFDVMNYVPRHRWWSLLPMKKGGHFIFDIWDSKKVRREGFRTTVKKVGNYTRTITATRNTKVVSLWIRVSVGKKLLFNEEHTMYLYTEKDIQKFCGDSFKIEEIKPTDRWQTWIKLKRIK